MNPKQIIGVSLCALQFVLLVAFGIPGYADEARAPKTPDVSGIAQLAAKAANKESLRLYHSAPFSSKNGSVELCKGRWHWHALVGYGLDGLEVDVTFSPAGGIEKIDLQKLAAYDFDVLVF